MKTTILIFLVCLSCNSLFGQKNSELQSPPPQQDTISIEKKSKPQENNRKPEIYSDQDNIERFRRNLPIDPHKRSVQDSIAERRFPGSSRFYGRSLARDAYRHGYGDAFIILPDTSSRQYLIIVNPITGDIRKY